MQPQEQPGDQCERECDPRRKAGPTREAGGTTGAGNLSPGQASRTGGATSGVDSQDIAKPTPANELPPDA
jgi:hypothetical protein